MTKTLAQYEAEISADIRRQDDEERAMEARTQDMWDMTLDEMDSALRASLRGRIGKHHRDRIQGLLDSLDDIATTATIYID